MVTRGRHWEWYDYHIVFWGVICVSFLVLPFAAWIFGWTIQ
jgi:hypothetical protein